MKRTRAFLLIFLITIVADSLLSAETGTEFTVEAIVGSVTVVTNNVKQTPKVGQAIGKNATIITGNRSMADVMYGDSGVIRVSENTTVTLARIIKENNIETEADLEKGGIMSILSKLVKGDNYTVKTKTTVVAVRGTSFEVSTDDEESQIEVIDGEVDVLPVFNGQVMREFRQIVGERQELRLNRDIIRDIIARRAEFNVRELREERLDQLRGRVEKIYENKRIFQRMSPELRNQIKSRILDLKLNKKEIRDRLLDDADKKKDLLRKQRDTIKKRMRPF